MAFAQGDCSGVPAMISFVAEQPCKGVACLNGLVVHCIDQDMHEFARQQFGVTPFILLERFNSTSTISSSTNASAGASGNANANASTTTEATTSTGCTGLASLGTAVAATGQCIKSGTMQRSAIAALETNNTMGVVSVFNDVNCQGTAQVTRSSLGRCFDTQARLVSNTDVVQESSSSRADAISNNQSRTLGPRIVPRPMQFNSNSDTRILIQVSVGSVAGFLLAVVGLIIVLKKRHEAPQSEFDTMSSVWESRIDHTAATNGSTHPHGRDRRARRTSRSGGADHLRGTSSQIHHMTSRTIQETARDPEVLAVRIPFKEVTTLEQIGHSMVSIVYRGSFGGQEVAIKRLCTDTRKDSRLIQLLFDEVLLLSRLEHPNVIQLVGVAWDLLTNLCIVYEFMARGDLRRLLECYRGWEYPKGFDETKLRIAFGVAKALAYLHSRCPKVIHANLKSSNVLLTEAFEVKVTSLTVSPPSSTRRSRSSAASVRCAATGEPGSSRWMAPEVMMGRKYDEKADVFSFGIVLSELDTHELPYQSAILRFSHVLSARNSTTPTRPSRSSTLTAGPDSTNLRASKRFSENVLLKQVALGQVHAQFSASPQESEIVALAMACLAVNPSDRPSAAEVSYKLHHLLRRFDADTS